MKYIRLFEELTVHLGDRYFKRLTDEDFTTLIKQYKPNLTTDEMQNLIRKKATPNNEWIISSHWMGGHGGFPVDGYDAGGIGKGVWRSGRKYDKFLMDLTYTKRIGSDDFDISERRQYYLLSLQDEYFVLIGYVRKQNPHYVRPAPVNGAFQPTREIWWDKQKFLCDGIQGLKKCIELIEKMHDETI
jgi:hypothetical protein